MLIDWNSNNPNSIGYFLNYLLILFISYIFIVILTKIIKSKLEFKEEKVYNLQNGQNMINVFRGNNIYKIEDLNEEQKSLRMRFLIVSTAIRAAIWVKAPYIFALYNRLHGFTRGDIGILYAVDNLSALIMGPILGGLGDVYGRKKFCLLYCFIVAFHIVIRLTGSQFWAYFAQFLTGMAGALIETVFESWLNFEASFMFSDDHSGTKLKNSFLREIFARYLCIYFHFN